jgi:hypothetical protein
MPLIAKVLLLALRTKRGRELLFAGGLGLLELARGPRARALYARADDLARGAAARIRQ